VEPHSMRLTFIGTSHRDPGGYVRLRAALERHAPEIVLVEVSPASLALRYTLGVICRALISLRIRRMGLALNAELRSMIEYFRPAYEYLAARDYCRAHGCALRLVDVSVLSIMRFFPSMGMVRARALARSARIEADRFHGERLSAQRIFLGGDELLTGLRLLQFEDGTVAFRERVLARRVRKALRRSPDARIAYVGGWEHCMDDPEGRTLYAALKGADLSNCAVERDILIASK